MGLDIYAAYGKDHDKYVKGNSLLPDNLFPENNLSGGMFSGGGSSFRGKIYDDYVTWATGETLYNEEIDSDTVKHMADMLAKADYFSFIRETGNHWGISEKETKQLTEWFRVVADENGTVVGWW